MTHTEHEIRRRILRGLRERIAAEREAIVKVYLLGLEAGELMKGDGEEDLRELGINFEEAKQLGVKMGPHSETKT